MCDPQIPDLTVQFITYLSQMYLTNYLLSIYIKHQFLHFNSLFDYFDQKMITLPTMLNPKEKWLFCIFLNKIN